MTDHLSRIWKRRLFLAISAVVTAGIMIAAHEVMLPFVLSIVVAYVLTPAVRALEKRRVPRWSAILLVYILSLGAIGGSISIMMPRLVAEAKSAAAEWPHLTEAARTRWLPAIDAKLSKWTGQPVVVETEESAPPPPEPSPLRLSKRPDGSFDLQINDGVTIRQVREGVFQIEPTNRKKGISSASVLHDAFAKIGTYVQENSLELLKLGQGIVMAISRAIFTLFMTLMLAGYIMLTREKILDFFRDLWLPETRDSFDRFLRHLDRGLSGVVRGQLIICLVNGALSAVGFWLFDLKYWPILAVVAAVMSLIPIFGSIMSSVPAVAIGLTQSPGTAFGVLAWIVGIHQLEANFLNPKIIGDAAKIHPVLVVMSLLVGEHFGGIAGALIAVPCMSIAQTLFLHFRETTLGLADPTASIPPSYRPSLDTPVIPLPPRAPEATPSSTGGTAPGGA